MRCKHKSKPAQLLLPSKEVYTEDTAHKQTHLPASTTDVSRKEAAGPEGKKSTLLQGECCHHSFRMPLGGCEMQGNSHGRLPLSHYCVQPASRVNQSVKSDKPNINMDSFILYHTLSGKVHHRFKSLKGWSLSLSCHP